MKGISAIIVTIMILMIAISLTGLGYITFTTFFSKITTSTEGAISSTLTTMLAQMKIESLTNSSGTTRAYIRNTGKVDITNFTAYVNDAYVAVIVKPTGDKIAPGTVDDVEIVSIDPNTGDLIKITTAQGAMAMQTLS